MKTFIVLCFSLCFVGGSKGNSSAALSSSMVISATLVSAVELSSVTETTKEFRSVTASVVSPNPSMTVGSPNGTSTIMVKASPSDNTAALSDAALSKSVVLPFPLATTASSLTTFTSVEPTTASTVKPTTSLSVNALGVPCKSPCLLVATTTEIIALDYNDGTIYPVISNLTTAVAIDIHFSLGYIFWSDVTERTIKRARNDGTNITVLHNDTGVIGGLAVDWMSMQLYWTDEFYNRISASDLEGNNVHILVSLSLDDPVGISLDPSHGFMFWTDWGQVPKIERAFLSGTQRVAIVTSNLQWPSGIDLDRRNRVLYWVDGGEMDRVESVDYHGNNRKLLFQQRGFLFFGLTFWSSNLFISDWSTDSIYKLNASHSNGTFVSNNTFKNIDIIFGIVGYDSSRQLPGILCEPLQLTSNLRVNSPCTGLPGDVCEFACERGYDMIGSPIIWCGSDGSWTGAQPRCDAVTCPTLSPPINGELSGCNTTEMLYNTVYRFSCNEGFEAKGSMVRRCTENGTWSGTELVCTGICGSVEAQVESV